MWDVSETQKVKTQIRAFTCQRGRGNALGPFISRPDRPVYSQAKGTENPDASLTMIDPATNWFKIAKYDDKKAATIADLVEQTWSAWYP